MGRYVCPICDGKINTKIEKIKLALPKQYHLPQEYNVVCCDMCGFCFSDTEATASDYDNYYSFFNSYSGTPVGDEEWDALYSIAEELIQPYVEKDAQLLDMGFGKGVFLRRMKKKGYNNIVGIDPSEESVKMVLKDNIQAEVGSIFTQPKERYKEKTECVFLFDVLEHLLFPLHAINNLKLYLKEKGYVLLSVPNYAGLKSNVHPITNVFNQEHINYFSEISLDNLMLKAGFCKINTRFKEDEELISLYQWDEARCTGNLKVDEICKDSILEYLQRFQVQKNIIESKLADIWDSGNKDIYVWGTGAYVCWLLANTILTDFNVLFIDNNPTKIGKAIGNSLIISPNQIELENRPILICSMLHGDDIMRQINAMGLKNRVVELV